MISKNAFIIVIGLLKLMNFLMSRWQYNDAQKIILAEQLQAMNARLAVVKQTVDDVAKMQEEEIDKELRG